MPETISGPRLSLSRPKCILSASRECLMEIAKQALLLAKKRVWRMAFAAALLVVVSIFSFAPHAIAHPVPFSYLDVRIEPGAIELTLVAHMFDVAHELGVDPPDRVLDPSVLGSEGDALLALLRSRLQIVAG